MCNAPNLIDKYRQTQEMMIYCSYHTNNSTSLFPVSDYSCLNNAYYSRFWSEVKTNFLFSSILVDVHKIKEG